MQGQDNSYRVGDPLAIIYNQGSWRLNKITALYNLQYSAVRLKQYSSKIKQAVVNSVAASTTKYSVKVEGQPNLKYSEDDADALVITVLSSTSELNAKPKVVYEALLLSWGTFNIVPNAVHLPYMIERGEQKIGTIAKQTLATIFDCKIKQYSFNQQHLLQFGFNFVESENSSLDKQVAFSYTTPQSDIKDRLTLQFELVDVLMIWNSVKEEVSKKSDLVNLTYRILQNQIYYMFVLDISALDLCEISMPKGAIKNNGTVKMKTPEMVNSVFTVLNEINNNESV